MLILSIISSIIKKNNWFLINNNKNENSKMIKKIYNYQKYYINTKIYKKIQKNFL